MDIEMTRWGTCKSWIQLEYLHGETFLYKVHVKSYGFLHVSTHKMILCIMWWKMKVRMRYKIWSDHNAIWQQTQIITIAILIWSPLLTSQKERSLAEVISVIAISCCVLTSTSEQELLSFLVFDQRISQGNQEFCWPPAFWQELLHLPLSADGTLERQTCWTLL